MVFFRMVDFNFHSSEGAALLPRRQGKGGHLTAGRLHLAALILQVQKRRVPVGTTSQIQNAKHLNHAPGPKYNISDEVNIYQRVIGFAHSN